MYQLARSPQMSLEMNTTKDVILPLVGKEYKLKTYGLLQIRPKKERKKDR